MEKLKKITALFLAVALLLPLLPGAAWATETAEVTEETFVVETAEEETAEEAAADETVAEEAAVEETTVDETAPEETAAEEVTMDEATADEAQETSPESSVSEETEEDASSEAEETDVLESIYSALYGTATIAETSTGSCGDDLTWVLTSDGVLTISGTGAMDDSPDFCSYSSSIQTVVIEDGVTSIGGYAFYNCSNLTSIIIPSSLTSIGELAFWGCDNLSDVYYAGSQFEWGYNIVWNDTYDLLDNATIHYNSTGPDDGDGNIVASGTCGDDLTWTLDGDGLLTISGSGPMENFKITYYYGDDGDLYPAPLLLPWSDYDSDIISVMIADGVTSIGDHAFYWCDSLTSITIPDSVTSIGEGTFGGCHSLTSISIPDSVTSIGDGAFYYCYSLTSVAIPDSVTSIGEGAFEICYSLTSVTIPDSVTSIGENAFEGCYSLTNVTIPGSVTTIGDYTFSCCHSLTSVTIPDSVTSIGNGAFDHCESLTSITIPDSVTSIGNEAFCCCESLTSITIPDSVTSIGSYAFSQCDNLTSVTIPGSVTSISEYAFSFCSNLTSITIPDSVTSIGNSAFDECYSLTDIYYVGSEDDWAEIEIGDYNDCLTSATIHYNSTGPEAGDDTTGFCGDNLTWTLNSDGVLTISGTGAMEDYPDFRSYSSSIRTVVIEDGVTSIGYGAFYDCSEMTGITIPSSVTSIGAEAFGECRSLTSVTIPSSVTSIGDYAFWYCTSLESIAIPDSVTSIGEYAFESCWSMTSVTLSSSLTEIPDYLFYYCETLTSVTIPSGVTSIGEWAFAGCDALTTVTIPTSVTSIGEYAFAWCWELSDVYYAGSAAEWAAIDIGSNNDCLTDATIHCALAVPVVTLSNTSTGVKVSWGAVDGADRYRVYRKASGDSSWTTLGYTTSTSYTDADAVSGTTYYYTVRAYSGSAYSGYSSKTIICLTQPTVTLSNTSSGVKISWGVVDGATSYKVYRKTSSSSSFSRIATISSGSTVTYTDTTAESGTTYYYTVQAYNGSYKSSYVSNKTIMRLAQPTVSLSNTSSGVKVSWGAVDGATSYRVYRKASGDSSWTTVKSSTTSTSYTDTTAKSGTTYYYSVRAYSGSYCSSYVTNKTIVRLAQPSVSLSNASGGVKVSWGAVDGATSYRVYRKASGETSWTTVKSSTTSTSYTDTTAKSGTTYYYSVRAYSGSSYSSYVTNKTIVRLAQPSITLANASGGVKVSWGAVDGATSYRVYRKASGDSSWTTVKSSTTSTSYTDTTAKSGTTYYYSVRAYSGSYSSSYVTNKTIVRLATPTLSSVTNSASKKMTVKWTKVSGVTGYQIQYSTSSSFSSYTTVKVTGASSVSKVISSLTKGKTYYVRIRTYKTVSGTNYYSGWSSKKSVKISK